MIHKLKVLDNFLGKDIVDALVKTLYNQVEEFPEQHRKYLAAIEELHTLLGPDAKHEVNKYVVAVEQKCSALLFFAGTAGLQMNYQHFLNPMSPTCVWPQVDYDDFLRPELAFDTPLYRSACRYMENFPYEIPEEIQNAINEYETELEICGLKLAHIYGYLMGDDLLIHCIPGYHPDISLGYRYQHMLEEYFGRPLDMSQWEGVIQPSRWKTAPIPEYDPQEVLVFRESICKNS